ncbi:endonuclease/exonuclease/phosphatase family protein [Micromonospora echinofusca]|uniref:Endonuclease n=1 Tax=Micromonospora echinofusca TaxID=47858 RepID=A0ABS3VY87_MICEH|nr:endonuclease/exonuclease/phosphatase family protein [Micromonospora echinofusca]MBO4209468.1 endonuclease [Micromonospora echinofusca]
MRHPRTATAATCLGVLLLVDVLRVWLPAIITIFGQAASTPAELMGAFALGWFLLPLAAPALIRRTGTRKVALAGALGLAASRLALTAAPGGQVQLYLASAGLLAGLVWLTAAAASGVRPRSGLVLGLALGAVGHTVLDTYDLVWRGGATAWTVSAVLAGLLVVAQAGVPETRTPGATRAWWPVGPVLLLAGMVALSPALAGTAVSYLGGAAGTARSLPWHGLPQGLLGAAATGLFVLAAHAWPDAGHRRTARWAASAVLLAGTALFALHQPLLLVPAILLTALGLGACLRLTDAVAVPVAGARPDPRAAVRAAYAAAGGMLVFAVAAVGYYAAYDLGYPNGWVPVAVAVVPALAALRSPARRPEARGADAPPATRAAGRRPEARMSGLRLAGGLALASLLAAILAVPVAPARTAPAAAPAGPAGTAGPAAVGPAAVGPAAVGPAAVGPAAVGPAAVGPAAVGPAGPVRLVAYNIRMGFGLDGRLDLTGLVDVLAGQRPDVLVLSEVDRGWLLNGGHDTLDLLAGRLRLPYVFAPAADPVWGDAVLTRFPVRDARTLRLPDVGAPTGAQALAVTVDLPGGELVVVSTHLQPPPDTGPVVQARAVARFATGYAAGRPLVVAGDLNTEPGDPAFAEFTAAGLTDALAAGRPLATSPADRPVEQIDHVFVSAQLRGRDVAAARSTASDHLPVAVTLEQR